MIGGGTIDIAGAARATGLSVKAIRGRVERGSLPAEMVDGRRRIPVRALLAAGLLVGEREAGAGAQRGVEGSGSLLDRLERQAEEIGRLKGHVEQLEAEVARLRGPR